MVSAGLEHDAEFDRLHFALVGSRLGLWDWDMVTGETVFNERWAEIVGYTLAELTPTTIDTWMRLAVPDDLARSEAAIAAHTRGETAFYDVEVRMRHRDGHDVWVRDRGQIIQWNDDGTPRRMVGTHQDITDRVVANLLLQESEERFSKMFSEHQAAMILVDPETATIVDANAAAERLYRFPSGGMRDLPVANVDPAGPMALREFAKQAPDIHGERVVTSIRADGVARQLEVKASFIVVGDRQLLFAIVNDVTDREEQAAQLRQSATVFDSVSEGVLITDAAGFITAVNPAFISLTGFTPDALIGRHARIIGDPRLDDDSARVMGDAHVMGEGSRDETAILHADGTSSPALVTVSPIKSAEGTTTGYVTLVADLAAHVQAELATLDRATTVDHVTELPNRRGFTDAVSRRLEHRRRDDLGSAVLLIDLDRFKDVNDSYGTGAGDELLREVGARLRAMAGRDDLVARLGPDEFAYFCHPVRRGDDADRAARHLQDVLAPPITVAPDVEVFVTACVGVALTEPGSPTGEEVMQRAAAALSDAKRVGSGSIRHHDESLTTVSRARLSLETRLRRAWENQELVLHYQPQVDVVSEQIVGAEALLRWPIEGGGMVPPASFIPLAEHIGLIAGIGAWVLEETCAQAARWRAEGLPDLTLAVNVSARQLANEAFAHQVHESLTRHAMPPRLLELELTESALLETGDRTLTLLDALSSLGVRLSIDDFGTGYSSFAYLKRFPLDQLKVDRSFISDLQTDPDAQAITAAIVALGHTLGLSVLAEGVETAGQLAVLRMQACDLFQGYLLAPALPPAAFAELVRSTL